MSIASEITRIQNAKASIKTAIENKGVEVGGDLIDTYADKIAEIIPHDTTMEDSLITKRLSGEYTNNRIARVGPQAFRETGITIFNSDSVTYIGGYAFYYIGSLTECNTPNVTSLSGAGTFTGCTRLKKINFSKNNTGIGQSCFRGCTALENAHIGNVTSITTEVFKDCTNLKTLIITKTKYVPALSNINSFTGSAIANGTGYVYVDDNLYDTYLTATNWSTYANQIKKISELPEGVEL